MPPSLSRLSQIQSKGMGGEDTYAYLGSDFFMRSVFTGFLSRRGWILQERLLSPRTIYYGGDEIYWECNHMIASESVPWGWINHSLMMAKINSYSGISGPLRRRNHNDTAIISGNHQPEQYAAGQQDLSNSETKPKRLNIVAVQPTTVLASLYEYWLKIVEIYSQKKLTVVTDKLPAIHGIARALHRFGMADRVFEECYHNGIWIKHDLTRQLLWIGEPGGAQQASMDDHLVTITIKMFTERVPTYTWASCRSSSVKFLLKHPPKFDLVENMHPPLLEEREVRLEWLDRVSSEYVTLPSNFFKTKIPKGSLELEGQLEFATLHIDAPELVVNESVLISGLLTFKDDPSSLTPIDTIIDASCTTDGSVLRWLEISHGTVWCLGIATADEASLSKDLKWPSCSSWSSSSEDAVDKAAHSALAACTFEYTLGLILVPTVEFLISLEKSPVMSRREQELESKLKSLSIWNDRYLLATPASFRRIGVYIISRELQQPLPPGLAARHRPTTNTTIFLA